MLCLFNLNQPAQKMVYPYLTYINQQNRWYPHDKCVSIYLHSVYLQVAIIKKNVFESKQQINV